MKITIGNEEFEASEVGTTTEGVRFIQIFEPGEGYTMYELKPVKKTESKKDYHIVLNDWENDVILDTETGKITPTTANKLSEAISALVEYMTAEDDIFLDNIRSRHFDAAVQARKSYKESQ